MPTLLPKQYAKILYELTEGKTGGDLEQAIEHYVAFLARERAVSKLPYIIDAFVAYAKKQQGIQAIHVTSARELSEKALADIVHIFGKKVEVETAVDPSLIGGVMVKTEGTIIDASVRGQLEQLHTQLS